MGQQKIAFIAVSEVDPRPVERGLEGLDYELILHLPKSMEETVEAVRGADVIIDMYAAMPEEVIASIDTASAIVSVGHGYEQIDSEAATEHGVMLANTADMCIEEVANHTLLLVLACSSRLLQLDSLVKEGAWRDSREEGAKVGQAYGQTLGMVGFGNIARATARRAAGFRMELLAHAPHAQPWTALDYGVELVGSLGELAERSDFVSMHVPLNNSTWRMAGETLFKRMKPTAYFINTCRGGIVDEEALISALSTGEIAGAGLDVFEQEPVEPDNPLLSMKNVITTPHTAGNSPLAVERALMRAGEEAARILRGSWPMSWVNPEVRTKLPPRMRATNV